MEQEYNTALQNIETSMRQVHESMQCLARLVEEQEEPINLVQDMHIEAQTEAREALDQITEVYDQRSWCHIL